jgi:hypothetical protein
MPTDGRISTALRTKSRQRRPRRARGLKLVELAGGQHGVVSLGQLESIGLSPSAVRTRVAAGTLHRVHAGVYAVGRPDLPKYGRWMAAVLACGEETLLSHGSAAALHELLGAGGGRIDVTIPHRRRGSKPGIRVHRFMSLSAPDRAVVRGIPCTSVPRTLLDLAAVAPRNVLERACDQAEVIGTLDMRAVRGLLVRRAGQQGVRRLATVLGTGEVGEQMAGSPLEKEFLDLCKRARFPLPSINEWLAIEGEEWQFDFVWHAERLIVEVDGWATHRTRRSFREDRRRDRLLRLAGWEIVRYTWDDVVHDAVRVEREVRSLIAEARTLGGRSGPRPS